MYPAVFEAYRKLSGSDIEDSIEGETSGNLENLLLAVGKSRSSSGALEEDQVTPTFSSQDLNYS